MGFSGSLARFQCSHTRDTRLSLLLSHSCSSRQPFLTGLGQEFRTLTLWCDSKQWWCLHHFQGQRTKCLSLTLQRGSRSEQDQAAASPEKHLMKAIFLPIGNYGKHLAPVQPQLVQLVYSLTLINHWCLGQPFQRSHPEDYRPSQPVQEENRNLGRERCHLLPSVRLWGNP